MDIIYKLLSLRLGPEEHTIVAEAMDEIERLREALEDCLSWHDYSADMHKPIEVRAAYMRARAALEGL